MSDHTVDAELLPYQAGADRAHIVDAAIRAFVVSGVIATGALFAGDASLEPFGGSGEIDGPVEIGAYEVSVSVLNGDLAVVTASLELYEVTSTPGIVADAALESFTADGTLIRGALLTPDALLRAYGAESTLGGDGIAVVDAGLQPYTASASILRGGTGDVAASLSPFTASATLIPGGVMAAVASLQPYGVEATEYAPSTFTARVTLDPYTVSGSITAPEVAITGAVVVNPRTHAVTEYLGTAFNSLCRFQGVILGAGADGIVSLDGDDDNGTEIAALLESGESNLGTEQEKRVPSGFSGYRTPGTLIVTLITDNGEENAYVLEPRQDDGRLHTSRVKFGRGVKGTYWQWRIQNEGGCSFDINAFKLLTEELSRRI